MGTKTEPGKYDCQAKAEDDEPVFVLLARDPVAPLIVELWADLRREMGRTEGEQLDEAMQLAKEMEAWALLRRRINSADAEAAWKRILERADRMSEAD